jgi:hypothetical protein
MKQTIKNNIQVFSNLFAQFQDLQFLFISPIFRTILAIIILFINVYSYYNNRIRYTKSKNIIFYITLAIFIIDIAFIYFLDVLAPLQLPKYWWIIIVFIAAIFLFSMDAKIILNDNTFNPPPLSLSRKKKRNYVFIILFIIYIFSFLLEYYINDTYDIAIDFTQVKHLYYIFLARAFGIILTLINLYLSFNFHACKYNLPDTWNL